MNKFCEDCHKTKKLKYFTKKSEKCYQCRRMHKRKLLIEQGETKRCSKCNVEKSMGKFRSFTVKSACMSCEAKKYRKTRKNKLEHKKNNNEKIICSSCGESKNVDDYNKNSSGYSCKKCLLLIYKKYITKKRNKYRTSNEHKVCRICNISKKLSDFNVSHNSCKKCYNTYTRNTRTKSTKEQKEQRNKRDREKYVNDECFRFLVNIRAKMRHILNKNVYSDETGEILGCDKNIFKKWLEFNYSDKINKYNHGSLWHLEHVIPVNTFDISNKEERKVCFRWYNVSVMIGFDNISKGTNILKKQITDHIDKIQLFTKEHEIKDNIKREINEYINLCATHLVAGTPSRL